VIALRRASSFVIDSCWITFQRSMVRQEVPSFAMASVPRLATQRPC
jgi:hypothetical protein